MMICCVPDDTLIAYCIYLFEMHCLLKFYPMNAVEQRKSSFAGIQILGFIDESNHVRTHKILLNT